MIAVLSSKGETKASKEDEEDLSFSKQVLERAMPSKLSSERAPI